MMKLMDNVDDYLIKRIRQKKYHDSKFTNTEPACKGRKRNRSSFIGGRRISDRLLVMGFTLGAEVTVIQNPGFGPVIVNVRDSRIALGRGEARKVMVSKKSL